MLKNKFKLSNSNYYMDEIIADNPNIISSKQIVGNASLVTQIGHLQLNIDIESNIISSIDGVITNPYSVDLSNLNFVNCDKKSLQLVSEVDIKTGMGYKFDFSGETYYDKNLQCLIVGNLNGNQLINIGHNSYALLSNINDNELKLNAIIIKPITLSKSFEIKLSSNIVNNISLM